MKTGIIVTCQHTGEWQNPAGGTVYYHQLTLDNGDVGNIGMMEKYSYKIKAGTLIQYTMDAKNKIKLLSNTSTPQLPMDVPATQAPAKGMAAKKTYSNGPKGPSDFLGFTWGYAKDLVIAGKTMDDVEELNKMARYIYEQIKDMLANDSQ